MTRVPVLVSRLIDLLLGARRDRDLDAELQLHLDLLTDDRGLTARIPASASCWSRRRPSPGRARLVPLRRARTVSPALTLRED